MEVPVADTIVVLLALACGVVTASLALVFARREREIPGERGHRWILHRVLPCGDVIEVCAECGDRRLFIVRPGQPIEVAVVPREKWEKAHDALAETLRRRSE